MSLADRRKAIAERELARRRAEGARYGEGEAKRVLAKMARQLDLDADTWEAVLTDVMIANPSGEVAEFLRGAIRYREAYTRSEEAGDLHVKASRSVPPKQEAPNTCLLYTSTLPTILRV